MSANFSQRFLLLTLFLLGLSACSSLQLGYNNIDTVSLFYLDSYLDLDADQKRKAEVGLAQLHEWHRRQELPVYSRALSISQTHLQNQLTLAQLMELNEAMRASLERTALQSVPWLSDLLLSLQPAQVAYLRESLDESNREFHEEYLVGEPAELLRRRQTQMIEQFEPWYGQLDGQQLALLRVASADWPVDNQFWYAERLSRQQELLSLIDFAVEQKPPRAEVEGRLRQFILGYERDRPVERQAKAEMAREHVMRLIVAINERSSDKQKQRVQARVQELLGDFSVLVAQR